MVEEFGQTRIELLKPEGDSIPVTSENRLISFLFAFQSGFVDWSAPSID